MAILVIGERAPHPIRIPLTNHSSPLNLLKSFISTHHVACAIFYKIGLSVALYTATCFNQLINRIKSFYSSDIPSHIRILHIAMSCMYVLFLCFTLNPITLPIGVLWTCYLLIGDTFWCSMLTQERLERTRLPLLLQRRAPEREIDSSHLRSLNRSLNDRTVPAAIRVSSLNELFNDINFDNPAAPNYIHPRIYTIEREQLQPQFIRERIRVIAGNIEGRIAFLGTPPAGSQDLEIFYQGLERALRLILHALRTRKEARDPDYPQIVGRLLAELARASRACAAGWQGNIMLLLEQFHPPQEGETLKEKLIECLAQERLNLVHELVQQRANFHAHGLPAYLQAVGETLGLPRTGNIREHLQRVSDGERNDLLERFFLRYNSLFISEKIRELLRKNERVGEMVDEWIKGHAGAWRNREFQQTAIRLYQGCQAILKQEPPVCPDNATLLSLITYCYQKDQALFTEEAEPETPIDLEFPMPVDPPWTQLLRRLFASDHGQEILAQNGYQSPLERRQLLGKLLEFSEASLVLDWAKNGCLHRENFARRLIIDQKPAQRAQAINLLFQQQHIPPLALAVLIRAARENRLQAQIQNHVDRHRREEFLNQCRNPDDGTLHPNALRWVLIRMGILNSG